MKKLLFLLTISTLNFNSVKAQTNVYHFFPDSNAFWQFEHVNYINPPYYLDQTRYGLNGDTLIGSYNYTKLYSLFDSTLTSTYSTYYAALREENKKVYTIFNGSSAEYLLYDFNLSVGDTIHYNYSGTFARVLASIDSVLLLDGAYRKRFNFNGAGSSAGPDVVIEGIGSNVGVGLFEPFVASQCTCADGYDFTCFKQNDTALYVVNPRCNRCFCEKLTGINNIKQLTAKISPNPFKTQTTLQTDEILINATLILSNSLGQIVKQIKNVNGQTITIQRDNLPNGIYFINITEGNKIIASSKLVIAD